MNALMEAASTKNKKKVSFVLLNIYFFKSWLKYRVGKRAEFLENKSGQHD